MSFQIAGDYLDGQTSKRHPCRLEVDGRKLEQVRVVVDSGGSEQMLEVSTKSLSIGSRVGNTPREVDLGDNRLFITRDHRSLKLLQQWLYQDRPSALFAHVMHRFESSWRWVVTAVGVTVLVIWGLFQYGIPLSAKVIAFHLPSVGVVAGSSLSILDRAYLEPTELAAERRKEIRQLVEPYLVEQGPIQPTLHFRSGMPANALALPSGEIVLTDDFVNLVDSDDELLAIVFHELGHHHHRHMTRRILQSSMMTLVVVLVAGSVDYADILSALPALVIDLSYSRDFEREADAYAFEKMGHQGIATTVFADVMLKLQHYYDDPSGDELGEVPAFLSTHPATEERIDDARAYEAAS